MILFGFLFIFRRLIDKIKEKTKGVHYAFSLIVIIIKKVNPDRNTVFRPTFDGDT